MRSRVVRRPVGALTVLVLVLGLAGCGDDDGTLDVLRDAADAGGTDEQPFTPVRPPGEADAWCDAYFDVEEFIDTLDPAFTEEEFQAVAAQILPAWSGLLTNAPAPVRDDIALIAEGFQRIAAGDLDVIEDPRYDEAFFRIEDYVFELCGFSWAD
jgi:hypothetical protein